MNLSNFSSGSRRATKVFLVFFVVIGLGLLLNSSFMPVQNSGMKVFAPSKDFSFLKRFSCVSDLFDKDQWHNNKGRSFDEDGVHLTNSKKHPVNSCHYALFCFDEFKITGDSTFHKAFMAQVKYLLDSTLYNEIDNDKIGYPYNITFHDLKAPWYSALAQSEAISVLIRYYALTGDDAVLPVITKLKNFMVASQDHGCGTMSITPEGNVWYEEYPNSKQERQVLNGFFLAIVALHEYSNLFPGDIETRLQCDAAIKTVKESFTFYDTGTWLKYNRGDGRQVANGYMKWQVLEMKLLYAITGDEYFKNLMMLVSTYCYDKPYETPGCKLAEYDFSIPLIAGKNDMLEPVGKSKQIPMSTNHAVVNTLFRTNPIEMGKVIDNNANTYAKLRYTDTLESKIFHITFDLKEKTEVGSFSVSYAGLDSLTKPTVSFFYKDSVTQKKLTKVNIVSSVKDVRGVTYRINKIKGKSFSVIFENIKAFDSILVSNISLFEPEVQDASDFVHYLSPVYKSGDSEASLNFEYRNMNKVIIFQKSAKDEKTLNSEKWDPLNVYTKLPLKILNPKGKFYRFLIVCEPQKTSASIGKLTFTQ